MAQPMRTSLADFRHVKNQFWIGLLICGVMIASGLVARATLVVEEAFNYGGAASALVGFNGGTGFQGAWSNAVGMGEFKYVPSGLTFGKLATNGGAAQVGTVSNVVPFLKTEACRRLALGSNMTGILYGSYLFSIPYYSSSRDSLAMLFGDASITTAGLGGSPDNNAQLDVAGLYYNGGNKGNVRLLGTGGSASGTAIATNTTYLALWQADGLVASGSGAEKLTLWILTGNQFDYFKTNGLTNLALNAALLGTASSNIVERATLAGNYAATFLQNSFVGLYVTLNASNTPIQMTFDEIRIGTGSLDEVTPVGTAPALPQIVNAPQSQSAFVGSTVQMNVNASGYPSLSYQWKARAVGTGAYTNLLANQNITGVTSAKLVISNFSSANVADYVVVAFNSTGAVTSSPPATLTISNQSPPQIVQPPASLAVRGGTPLTQLSVVASGAALSYQWMSGAVGSGIYTNLADGGNLSGSATATLSLLNASSDDAGNYVVVVSNQAGSVTSTPPATLSFFQTSNSVPDWALGPFYRVNGVNPIVTSNVNATFMDPILNQPVPWKYSHTFNPAAVVMNDKVHVLYRAEDNTGTKIGSFCSRIGLASSEDGLHFTSNPTPTLYPKLDAQQGNEWTGGCEDPRVVATEDGTFVVLYTQWNRSLARLGVATSTNLLDWTKYGSPFATYGTSAVSSNTASKSAGILTSLRDGQLKACKHMGQYWMYWGEGSVKVATSDDLINWRPTGPTVLTTRAGKFDSSLAEVGAPAVVTPKGIVVFYNGKNANPGDTNLAPSAYSGGQALFDAKEPTKLVARMDTPFFQPETPDEVTGQYAGGTTFVEGLVAFQNKWFMYYGAADSYVGVAVCDQANFGLSVPWPTNCYYQGFDGLSVGATNSVDGAVLYSTSLGNVATVQDSFQKELRLTAAGVSNVTSAFVLSDIAGSNAVYGFSATWNSEFYFTNSPGGGLSFSLSPVADATILGLPVEQGYGQGLSVCVDNDGQGTQGFFVRLNGTNVASHAFDPNTQWGQLNTRRHFFSVDWNYATGLTLYVDGATIFTNVPTPTFSPKPGMRFSWAARTTVNTEDARVDNICVFANANLVPVPLSPSFAASGSAGGNVVSNAFDGNDSTQWQIASSAGWIRATCAQGAQAVAAYRVVPAATNWQQDPRNWTLEGSNDGTNWVTVDAEYLEGWGNDDVAMRRVPRTFLVNQPAAYRMYQMNIATNNGAPATQLAELTLYSAQSIDAPKPIIRNINTDGANVYLHGTGGVPFADYSVLASTNLSLPLTQWSKSGTDRFDDSGSFAFTNALNLNSLSLFLRLSMP